MDAIKNAHSRDTSCRNALMQLREVCFSYEEEPVLNDISFQCRRGEFIGVIGPNGSGKSTLLKLMGGILKTNQGRLLFKNRELKDYKTKELAQSISWLPQENQLIFPFKVLDVVLMGRHPYLSRLAFEGEEDFRIAHRAMEMTHVSDFSNRLFNEISGGEKQRVMLAGAIAQEPEMMLLDEPTSSLDIKYQIEILNILKRLNEDDGLTLVLALHDLHLAARFCDRLALLDKGRIVRSGTPDHVLEKEALETVYGIKVKILRNPDDGSIWVSPG
ncbi:MAG: ABC transporter ATP-binding protein [Nitrospinales bacterium]